MSLIAKIAFRRLKKDRRKNIFSALAVFFSLIVISFFITFSAQISAAQSSEIASLPFEDFLEKLKLGMTVTVVLSVLITFVLLRINFTMRRNENSHTLSVLSSIGASYRQRSMLIVFDIIVLYLPLTVLGTVTGVLIGAFLGNSIPNSPPLSPADVIMTALPTVLAALLLIFLCSFLPDLKFKRRSLIQSVRKQNTEVAAVRHGYRQSETYKNQALLKRLAKKSAEYHARIYNNIAVSFSVSALYPMIAVFLFASLAGSEVIIDYNLYDGIDTASGVIHAVDSIAIFLVGCFLVLGFIGILQAVFIAKAQISERKKTALLYASVGMTKSDINKMIRIEIGSVIFKTAVLLLFLGTAASAFYGAII